jgi:hypothetical protein
VIGPAAGAALKVNRGARVNTGWILASELQLNVGVEDVGASGATRVPIPCAQELIQVATVGHQDASLSNSRCSGAAIVMSSLCVAMMSSCRAGPGCCRAEARTAFQGRACRSSRRDRSGSRRRSELRGSGSGRLCDVVDESLRPPRPERCTFLEGRSEIERQLGAGPSAAYEDAAVWRRFEGFGVVGDLAGAAAAFNFALAPRPRARRRATAANRRASFTELSNNLPVSAVSFNTSCLASLERRRTVRVIARNLRPIARERSRTRRFFSPISCASLRPSRASTRTPLEASPRVGRRLHIRLDHRRIDPHRPRAKPLLPRRPHDQRAR